MPHPDDAVTIGLDAGTSGLKAVALDASGNTLAEATRSYPLLTPQPGWTEQDPNAWWTAACEAIEGGWQFTVRVTMEREGSDKPVCVAESISRRYA